MNNKNHPQLVTDLRPPVKKSGGSLAKLVKNIKRNPRRLLIIAVAVIIAILTYGYWDTKNELKRLSNPQVASQNATKELVASVGNLIELPTDETPTIATVNDSSKLSSQDFFARAKNGDKVMIYSKSGRAVLYRPSTNKVIEYSKVNLNGT